MSHIFISHTEHDAEIALEIALSLEKAGYTTWFYELDSIPGPSYLIQTGQAIEKTQSIILIISPSSLGSRQVTNEVVRAHESGKYFIPILRDITHIEFQNRQPEWREAVGAATSIRIPSEGVAGIHERIISGLNALGIQPGSVPDATRIKRIAKTLDEFRTGNIPKKPEPESPTAQKPIVNLDKGNKKWKALMPAIIALGSIAIILLILFGAGIFEGGLMRKDSVSITATSSATPAPITAPISTLTTGDNVSIVKGFGIPLGEINGIAWAGTNLWIITNSGDMFKMNTGGDILASCRTPEISPEGLAWDGETFWIFTTNYNYIYGFSIDESGAKPKTRTISMFKSPNEITGGTNDGLAWDGANLWYSDRHNVYNLDIKGNVLGSFAFAHEVAGLAWDGEYLWMAYNDTLAQVDKKGKILHSIKSPVSQINALTWGNGYLWAVVSDSLAGQSKIYAMDPQITAVQTQNPANEGHEVVTDIKSTGFKAPYGARGIAWDGTSLWLADIISGRIFKINPNGEMLGNYSSPAIRPSGLTWDGATFWIFDSENDTIHQFTLDESGDIPRMQILKSFAAPQNQDIGGTNGGLVWGDNGLWYSDRYIIYRLDISGIVLNTIKIPNHIRGLAWDGEHLWLAYDSYPNGNTLAKIDSQGHTLLSINSGVYTVYDLAWGDGYIWVLGDDRDITKPVSSGTMVFKTTWIAKATAGS